MTLKIALLCTVVALLQLKVTSHSGWRPPTGSPTTSSPPTGSPTMCLPPIESSATCSCTWVIMEEPVCPCALGLSSYKPAKSCREILQCNPSAQSGYYWLKSTSTDSQEVYCSMDTPYCDITGGWMRLVNFNITEPGASCPSSLWQINTPAKLCGRSGRGCYRVTFPTDGIRYSKVCRQARGYQYYSPDGFGHSSNNINSHYVDGVAITYGSPRQHLWTYAAGLSDDGNHEGGKFNCPCAKYPGYNPPDFVGLDYYCESGITSQWRDNNRIALEDPLWDGDGCGRGNNCCNQTGLPWFYRTLPQKVGDDIEVRLCGSDGIDNEEAYLELVEIYVQWPQHSRMNTTYLAGVYSAH